ncbi:MAG: hypothetical protein OXH00_25645 [Candidatus Poribacteria bacterium]|nr:hypothetical protein [Candidatus Poribacteria bacterium]
MPSLLVQILPVQNPPVLVSEVIDYRLRGVHVAQGLEPQLQGGGDCLFQFRGIFFIFWAAVVEIHVTDDPVILMHYMYHEVMSYLERMFQRAEALH